MSRRSLAALIGAVVGSVAVVALPVTPAAGTERPDPVTSAKRHLVADASGAVSLASGRDGRVDFVGTRSSVSVDNPDVRPGDTVAAAARAHLDRYGALLGATGGTAYVRRSIAHAASGVDVVTYQQEVGGVPVIGGDVVVSLAADRGLRSLQSTISTVGSVSAPAVSEEDAAATARAAVDRRGQRSDLHVSRLGRWLLDPEVVDVRLPGGPRTVWRFEVGDHAATRQLVLIDDRTGRVLLRSDLVEHADPDRVVCDDGNVRSDPTPCTSGFARTEGGPASSTSDVNDAFDLSGAVSDFYAQVAGVSLTQLLGVDTASGKKLASTVRFCTMYAGDGCPYDNAFWNGQQMFYGQGWAGADDVVGHEITHGFIDQYSKLFYWGQSGAINESMADIMGEIIDHRRGSDDDSGWLLGEDSPHGAIRSLADPTEFGQPATMTSPDYTEDADYTDNGGVHTNSGVGNQTAYLISQGGTFDGQTITGIDDGDPTLAKTARLYVDVIERLGSAADYAALAAQLDQSCQDLVAQGVAGFTTSHCASVHQAGVATELTSPPAFLSGRQQAETGCAGGYTKRLLFDSEIGDPAAAFTPDAGGPSRWRRGTGVFTDDAWFADDPDTVGADSLTLTDAVALPAGQPSYLSFRGWWVLDFVPPGWDDHGYYDGGTVSVSVDGGPGQSPAAGWTNGPNQVLSTNYGNPWGGWAAFAGDSRGWVRSRLDLGDYAGHSVRPSFTLRSDGAVGLYGWALDDITIYTCDRNVPSAPQGLRVVGTPDGATLSWAPPATFPGMVTGYTVQNSLHPGSTALPATVQTWHYCCAARRISSVTLSVSTNWGPWPAVGPASIVVTRGVPAMTARRRGTSLRLKGSVHGGGQPVTGGVVVIEREYRGVWRAVGRARVGPDGRFATRIRHARRAYYRANFRGSVGFMGTPSPRHRW